MSDQIRDLFYYQTFNSTLTHVFEILSKTIAVNTFILTLEENGGCKVIKVWNRSEILIEEGSQLPVLSETENLDSSFELLRSKHFIAIPVTLQNGEVFGKLWAIHSQPFEFSEFDGSVLQTAGQLISQTIDLENLIIKDTLTPHYNRSFIQNYFKYDKVKSSTLAFIFLDLDNFKSINDTFGHDYGDLLLKEMAKRIESCIGPDDILARIGGDEFIVLNQNSHSGNRSKLQELAQKILDRISEPVTINKMNVKITGSIGISFYPENGKDMNELLKQADISMYAVKGQGKNGIQFYQKELESTSTNRFIMENSLRTALENNELEVYYQPIFHLQTNQLVCYEALLRWHHPELGMVSPAEFIPIAEETGLIIPIGHWVLKTVCEQGRSWREKGLHAKFSVNLSAKQFEDQTLLNRIKTILVETKFPACQLQFEITESMLMKDVQYASKILRQIEALGIEVGIDDFGTGYSSLTYLNELPISFLKIDKSFTLNLYKDQQTMKIAKAIINLAQTLKIKSIAEGIEENEHLDFLLDHHSDYGQGYLLGKPMPAKEAEAFTLKKR
ncbi:EAL domain-containing protein [Bacillota bacterium Lsc_1132]